MLSIVHASVDERSDDIFALTGPYNANEGAPVLRFTARGDLKKRYRCILPRKQDQVTAVNKVGVFLPNLIAVLENRLVLTSASQKICYLYPLD
jgi:hypothetical protein